MTFLDEMFDNITSFYTIMYMDLIQTKAFLKEAYRVLKPNGLLWIWDTDIPLLDEKDIFIVPIETKLNHTDIVSAGFGIGGAAEQTMISLQKHIIDVGFCIEKSQVFEKRFELCCRKTK